MNTNSSRTSLLRKLTSSHPEQRAWVFYGFAILFLTGCFGSSGPITFTAHETVLVLDEDEKNSKNKQTVSSQDTLVQFSLLASLATGDYAGEFSLQEVLKTGDFGIGTFDRLDGELILLDGQVYQAMADGSVRKSDSWERTPFVASTFFQEDGLIEEFSAKTLPHLEEQLDQMLSRQNIPYAIRIDGDFPIMRFRSVPAQEPPFKPLLEVVKDQPTWTHQNVSGTLVGFRCPTWVGTLNVSGYHWHFLSDDRQIGGHVLACELKTGTLRFDEKQSLLIRLPKSKQFEQFDTNTIQKQDIHTIERQREDSTSPKTTSP